MRTVTAAILLLVACAMALPTPDTVVPENELAQVHHDHADHDDHHDHHEEEHVDPSAIQKAEKLKAAAAEAMKAAAKAAYNAKKTELKAHKEEHKLNMVNKKNKANVKLTDNQHILRRFKEKGKEITPDMMARYHGHQQELHDQRHAAKKEYEQRKEELHEQHKQARHEYHKEKDHQNGKIDKANHNAAHPNQVAAQKESEAKAQHAQDHPNQPQTPAEAQKEDKEKAAKDDLMSIPTQFTPPGMLRPLPGMRLPDPAMHGRADPAMRGDKDPAFAGLKDPGNGDSKRDVPDVPAFLPDNDRFKGLAPGPRDDLPDRHDKGGRDTPSFEKGLPKLIPPSESEQRRDLFRIPKRP